MAMVAQKSIANDVEQQSRKQGRSCCSQFQSGESEDRAQQCYEHTMCLRNSVAHLKTTAKAVVEASGTEASSRSWFRLCFVRRISEDKLYIAGHNWWVVVTRQSTAKVL